MTDLKTNARSFTDLQPLPLPLGYRIVSKVRSFFKRVRVMDDFDWDSYNVHYRAEVAWNRRQFTEDLKTIDYRLIEGRIYLLGDCKPLNLSWRCVYEAVYNLPGITSMTEIGVGGGRNIANLRTLLGDGVQIGAYDLSEHQLRFFKEEYPEVYEAATVGVLDLTKDHVPEADRSDVVLAVTVLMHIQRPEAYKQALQNLLQSGRKYVVLMDHWNAHDYFADLSAIVGVDKLFVYDSGANNAIVVSLQGETLPAPYEPLTQSSILGKYLPDYRY